MKEKILLINVHSSCNAGDHALTLVAISQLKKNFPGCEIEIVIDDPDSYPGEESTISSIISWVQKPSTNGRKRWRLANLLILLPVTIMPLLFFRLTGRLYQFLVPKGLRTLLLAYTQADLLVSKPGGFLYSSGKGLNLFLSIYSMVMAFAANKPLYILPQSIGPFSRGWECLLARWTLERTRVVMLREEVSRRYLELCGFSHPRCYVLPDMAFTFEGAPDSEAEEWLQRQSIRLSEDRPLLGLTVINWGEENKTFSQQDAYESAISQAATYFINQLNGKVLIFTQVCGPSHSQDDRIPSRRILTRLEPVRSSVFFFNEAQTPELLKSAYRCMDVFIGTRMHSNIFALSEGVPVLAIGYQHKTAGIIDMLGLSEWVIDINQVQADRLVNDLERLYEQRGEIKARIEAIMPEIVRSANRAGEIIAEDYASFGE